MPKLKNRLPKVCRDRNQAFSWHNGKRIYHGVWGSPEAEKSYKRFIAALLESPNLPLQGVEGGEVFIAELADGYLDHIEKSRIDEKEYLHFKSSIAYLIEVYGELTVNEFSPKKLTAVRSQMVKAGTLCRLMINKYIGRIRRIFEWGVREEFVQSNVSNALKAVKDLRKGEEGAYDNPPRKPVPDSVVEATLPFLPPVVAAMVQVQRLIGARPSEVFIMRVGDIDQNRGNGLWYYSPKHKTERHIGEKPLPLGKPEQRLITPYLEGKKPEAAIFSPRQAVKERAEQARARRKTKVPPSQQKRAEHQIKNPPDRQIGEFYNSDSYRRAVKYAIEKGNRHGVKIPHWSPYQLRKSAATAIELEHGLDEAQAQLGHTTADMTKRYSAAQLKQREKLAHSRVNPFEKPVE
ncbi:MAG: site-specific integrase [Planctomycetaceae bacterium]|nr:site-specific integrase [Planctomycetaceae bacterium]